MDGEPDDSIDENLQLWAKSKIQEHQYRRLFGLTAYEMAEEPMDEVILHLKIHQLINKKGEIDQKLMEQKSKHGIR